MPATAAVEGGGEEAEEEENLRPRGSLVAVGGEAGDGLSSEVWSATCPAGSTVLTRSVEGFALACASCPGASYCPAGTAVGGAPPCPAGRYGDAAGGLSDAACR